MSYLVQCSTQRSADRAEARRQKVALAEARYAQRVGVIDRFLACAQDAERVAFDRHVGGADGPDWQRMAAAAMDSLYVAEKMTRVLCSNELHEAAHSFTNTIRKAIYYQVAKFDVDSYLLADRADFLTAARQELERLQAVA
jgi:hypothetical protein